MCLMCGVVKNKEKTIEKKIQGIQVSIIDACN